MLKVHNQCINSTTKVLSPIESSHPFPHCIMGIENQQLSPRPKVVSNGDSKELTYYNKIKSDIISHTIAPHTVNAMYGFSTPRFYAYDFLNHYHSTTPNCSIDELNVILEGNRDHSKLNPHLYSPSIIALDKSISKLLYMLSDETVEHTSTSLTERNRSHDKLKMDLAQKWKTYLQNNKNKVDIFRYLGSKNVSPEEKSRLLKKLIIKNIRDERDTHILHDFLIKNNLISSASLEMFKESLFQLPDSILKKSIAEIRLLPELIENHFFRNTSKLSFDFFNHQNFNLLFAWDSNEDSLISLPEVNLKPYKSMQKRKHNNRSAPEPVTYSEIRHLYKNKNKFSKNLHRISLSEDTVKFSHGLDGDWYTFDKKRLSAN